MSPRTILALTAATALTLTVTLAGTESAMADAAPDLDQPDQLSDMPDPGAPDPLWRVWAARDRVAAVNHDWDADSAARGCELVELEILEEVDEDYNTAIGAPADLATVRVDRVEDCAEGAMESHASGSDRRPGAVAPGTSCNNGTKGPGTICLSSSGGRITASWHFRGSGQERGFLRVYQIPAGSNGCPTGSTWLTSPSMTWNSGQTRSTSKAQSQSGAYSAHIWRANTIGHSDWGATCDVF